MHLLLLIASSRLVKRSVPADCNIQPRDCLTSLPACLLTDLPAYRSALPCPALPTLCTPDI
jgi:hypothetical protein